MKFRYHEGPSQELWGAEESEENVRRAVAFAHDLEPMPDKDAANPVPDDELTDQAETSALRGVTASSSVARRLRLPLYSDDRFVRQQLRQLAIPTFGTLVVLDALVGAQLITGNDRERAKQALREHNSVGVN